MIVIIGDQKYYVRFSYVRKSRDKTICQIAHNGEVVSQGFTRRHEEDKFDKEQGRRASFANALKVFDREARTIFWNVYWARKPKPDVHTPQLPYVQAAA